MRTNPALRHRVEQDLAALLDVNGARRRAARLDLVAFGPRVSGLLEYRLAHGSPAQRIAAAHVLSDVPSDRAILALLRSFEDPDPGVRFSAADALAEHSEHAIRPLLRALIDRGHSPWFRECAAQCFSRLSGRGVRTGAGRVAAALLDSRRFVLIPLLALEALSGDG